MSPYVPPPAVGGIDVSIGGNSTSGGAGYALISSGTMILAGAANITLSQDGQNISISGGAGGAGGIAADIGGNSTSAGAGYITITNGTMLLAGGNNVTLSQNGSNITISGGAQTAQTQSNLQAVVPLGNTTGTTGSIQTGTFGLAGGNNITISQSSGTASTNLTISAAAQTAQTQSNLQAVVPLGNTTGTTGSIQTGTFGLAGGNNITISQSSGTASTNLTISAANQTVQTQNMVAVSATNTLYSSGTVLFTGSNMITVKSSANNQTIILDATQSVQTQNLFNLVLSTAAGGATSGTMGTVSSGTLTLYAGNNITLSQSATSQITISALASSSLSASANITISSNGSTISFSVAAPNSFNAHVWENMPMLHAGPMTYLTAISKTPFYWPEIIPGKMTLNSVGFLASVVTTGTLQSFSVHFGVYSYVNSTSAALIQSVSETFLLSTATSASFSGQRMWILTSPSTATGISNLTPGAYLFGSMISAGATGSMNLSLYGATNNSAVGPLGIILPGANQASTGLTQGALMQGMGSTTVNAMPANVSRADLTVQGSGASVPIHPYMLIRS